MSIALTKLPLFALLAALAFPVSGCALLAGGIAGGVIATEAIEDDGKIDPLENTEIGKTIYE